jgi:mediator of RNA polymerase II transcription subunit 7
MADKRAAVAWPQPPDQYTAFTDPDAMNRPRPPSGPITVFGDPQQFDPTIPSLSEQNIPTLYDESSPPLSELKKVNHQILFTFQKLVGIIAIGEEGPDECLEHLKHLFMNAHHLLHRLRSVQAYENMHQCLRDQNLRLEKFKQKFDRKLEKMAALRPP